MGIAKPLATGAALAVLAALLGATRLTYESRPTIARAFDLIEDFPAKVPVNTPAVFKVRASASAKSVVRAGVIVRVFSLAPHLSRPEPVTRIEDCDIYLSTSYRLQAVTESESRLEGIAALDKNWLNLSNSLRTVEPGHYFFVFERTESAVVGSHHFRLKAEDAENYFKTGFKVVIDPTGAEIAAEPLRSKYLDREVSFGRLKADADNRPASIPCFRFEPVSVQAKIGNRVIQGALLACAPGKKSDSVQG